MATEHRLIPDTERHEVRGASTATLGQVLQSDGDGTTSFVDPLTLDNISFVSTLSNSNTATINPSATDTPIIAGFTSTVSNSDITMDSSGLITVNTPGLYSCGFNMNFGRSTNVGNAITVARLLINDVQFGFTQGIIQSATANSRPVRIDMFLNLEAGDELKVQLMRDSAGANDGGLYAQAITDATWGDIPSWFVRMSRIAGAT